MDALTGALIEDGYIGGGGYDFYQGSIAVNALGEAVVGYNRSGGPDKGIDGRISFFAQAFVTDSSGGLDLNGGSLLLRRSDVDNYDHPRWGDYSAVTLDPLNPRRFWAIGEFATTNPVNPAVSNWATYVSALEVPGPLPVLGVGSGLFWSRRLRRRIAAAASAPSQRV